MADADTCYSCKKECGPDADRVEVGALYGWAHRQCRADFLAAGPKGPDEPATVPTEYRIVCSCGAVGARFVDDEEDCLQLGWRAVHIPARGDQGALLIYRCALCRVADAEAGPKHLSKDERRQAAAVLARLREVFSLEVP